MNEVTKALWSGLVVGAVVTTCVFGFVYSVNELRETPSLRTVTAFEHSREYVDDHYNVTFIASDGNRYVVEDYAANFGATFYELKLLTNKTEEYVDAEIVEITQVTDLKKSEYLKPQKIE